MRAPRPITGYISKRAAPPLDKMVLHCSDTVRNELIGSFEFYSEVTKAGRALLAKNGHHDPQQSFPRFQSYMRQARTFYAGAELLHYRASPLNFYYSFMNFAKAIVFAHDATFLDVNLKHGVSAGNTTGSLRRHFLTVHQNGVFPSFYRSTMTKGIQAGTKARIATLLGYTSDVAFEYVQLNLGPERVKRCRIAFVHHQRQAHVVVAVQRRTARHLNTIINSSSRFEAVSLGLDVAKMLFGITAETLPGFTFYETKKLYPVAGGLPVQAMVKDLVKHFGSHWSLHPFAAEDVTLELNAPLNSKKAAMNEALAIYLTMYYLGSLVRYRPWVLEDMLSTQEAWLIERFVKSAPITFLRHARNMLDDQYLAYTMR